MIEQYDSTHTNKNTVDIQMYMNIIELQLKIIINQTKQLVTTRQPKATTLFILKLFT
jgi:hypothetical protein